MHKIWKQPAAVVRVLPFALFMVLLALRGALPADNAWGLDPRWVYGVTVLLVAGLLATFWGRYGELARQLAPTMNETGLAVAVGLGVFALWIQLDAPWMQLGTPTAGFVPVSPQGQLQWPLVAVRWLGAALLVPLMEELFWRSFLMRWIENERFDTVPPRRVRIKAIVLSTFVFTLAHTLWLAAAIAGMAYALLYVRTGKLWVPIVAHAVTNGALGAWVVWSGRWEFW
jgi:CAAX prenyl protease-like protein